MVLPRLSEAEELTETASIWAKRFYHDLPQLTERKVAHVFKETRGGKSIAQLFHEEEVAEEFTKIDMTALRAAYLTSPHQAELEREQHEGQAISV